MSDSHFLFDRRRMLQSAVERKTQCNVKLTNYDKLVLITPGVGCVQKSGLGLVPFAFQHFSQDDRGKN